MIRVLPFAVRALRYWAALADALADVVTAEMKRQIDETAIHQPDDEPRDQCERMAQLGGAAALLVRSDGCEGHYKAYACDSP
jgi:hypothetical protein